LEFEVGSFGSYFLKMFGFWAEERGLLLSGRALAWHMQGPKLDPSTAKINKYINFKMFSSSLYKAR
jgi:hypothetical protein